MPAGATAQQAVHRARQLVAQHDYAAAQQVLRDELNRTSQDPSRAGSGDADLAVLYAAVLLELNEPHTARSWAVYAQTAMRRLHGERDRRTLHALGVLACAQHRAGALERASRSYHDLVAVLTGEEGESGDRTLAARADAAVVEHARGQCTHARSMLADVVAAYTAQHGPGHRMGLRMTVRLAAMWRDCGDFDYAHQLLGQARTQAAELAPEDPVHALLQASARAPASAAHRCGISVDTLPSTYADTAAGRDTAPEPPALLLVPEPHDLIPRAGHTRIEWPDDELSAGAPARFPEQPAAPIPALQLPAPRFTMPATYRPPANPPSVYSAPARDGRSWLPAAVASLAALIAAGALVAALVLSAAGKPAPEDTPMASAAIPEPVTGAVANLDLIDEGDRVLLTWVYPTDATGPLIVSMARAGEPMRPMQSLPAGSESIRLPGLDPSRSYCFTVTVVYRTDHTVMAPPVCTDRG